MLDIQKAREQFPYLKHGKIYFNHASTGPLCTPVLENIAKVLYEKSETNIDEYTELQSIINETKSDLASLINSSPERIAFLDNTSNGINLLASGLKWNEGDRVLINDLEFPANVYPFLNLKKFGVEIDLVKSQDGIVAADDVIEMIKPTTKLVTISQVQFLTGYRVDLEKIGKVCRDKDIVFCVDAIQGLGAVRLDVVKDSIDFIAAGSQKWLLGLQGLSFIYVSEKLQEKIEPAYAGWLSVEDAWNFLDYNLKLKNTADRFQGGTLNSVGIYALNASLKFFKQFGFDETENSIIENSTFLIRKLEDIGINLVLSGCDKKNIAGIVSFQHKNSQKIFEALSQKKIQCAVRSGYVRLSPHFYNTKDETDIVINELKQLI